MIPEHDLTHIQVYQQVLHILPALGLTFSIPCPTLPAIIWFVTTTKTIPKLQQILQVYSMPFFLCKSFLLPPQLYNTSLTVGNHTASGIWHGSPLNTALTGRNHSAVWHTLLSSSKYSLKTKEKVSICYVTSKQLIFPTLAYVCMVWCMYTFIGQLLTESSLIIPNLFTEAGSFN